MDILQTFFPNTSAVVGKTESYDSPRKIIKPSEVLFEWEAPERLFKKRGKEFYRKIGVIIIFFELMLLIIKEFPIMIVLGIVFFAVYVFTSYPPKIVVHKITTNGILFASQHLFMWEDLVSFFFEKRDDVDILVVNTKEVMPGRLLLLLSKDIDQAALSAKINEYISIVEKPEANVYEQFTKKLGSRLNI